MVQHTLPYHMVGLIRKTGRHTLETLRASIVKANYYAGAYQHRVWLIGDGRSGTTFLSDLINHHQRYREMFEPFHPALIKPMQNLAMHEYIRPDTPSHPFWPLAQRVLQGKFTYPSVDAMNRRLHYRGLLVKDIFANLFATWAIRQSADNRLKVILLIRNPFAVALSKYKKKNWIWLTEPRAFLKQPNLVADYLEPYVDVIQAVGDDYIERQVLIWAILHYVPFQQLTSNQIHVVFYEDLIDQPEATLQHLFEYLSPQDSAEQLNKAMTLFNKPSRVAGSNSNIVQGNSPIESWRKELTSKQIDTGLALLEKFGLEKMYDETGRPRKAQLEAWR